MTLVFFCSAEGDNVVPGIELTCKAYAPILFFLFFFFEGGTPV